MCKIKGTPKRNVEESTASSIIYVLVVEVLQEMRLSARLNNSALVLYTQKYKLKLQSLLQNYVRGGF